MMIDDADGGVEWLTLGSAPGPKRALRRKRIKKRFTYFSRTISLRINKESVCFQLFVDIDVVCTMS